MHAFSLIPAHEKETADAKHIVYCGCIIYTDPIAVMSLEFGTGAVNTSVPILLRVVKCEGHEENIITECGHSGVNDYDTCKHFEDAGVVCQGMNLDSFSM